MRSKRIVSLLTALCLGFALLHHSIGMAFIGAPDIQLAPASPLEEGVDYTIKAKVHDEYGIDKVILHYRMIGETEYRTRPMTPGDASDIYGVTLTPEDLTEPGIQYYVRAISMTGAVSAMPDLRQTTIEVVYSHLKDKEKGGASKWIWAGLGMLVLGALLSGGGGGGGNDTIITTPPITTPDPTADATITAPLAPDNP